MERKKSSTASASQKLYRSIREVSEHLDVKPHVLRYWETQFPALRPKKNRAGNRIYRPSEVDLLERIKSLLYEQRFTIEGARRLLEDERRKPAVAANVAEAAPSMGVADVVESVATIPTAPLANESDALAAASAEIAGLRAALVEAERSLEEARVQLAARATRDLDRLEALAELRREMESALRSLREAPREEMAAETHVDVISAPAHEGVHVSANAVATDEEENAAPITSESLVPAPGFA